MKHTRPGRKALSPYQRMEKWVAERTIVQDPETDCWLWMGSLWGGGYAYLNRCPRCVIADSLGAHSDVRVHRWTYELHRAQIPAGLATDGSRACRACRRRYAAESRSRRAARYGRTA